jgi:hypothetical protein
MKGPTTKQEEVSRTQCFVIDRIQMSYQLALENYKIENLGNQLYSLGISARIFRYLRVLQEKHLKKRNPTSTSSSVLVSVYARLSKAKY